MPRLQPVAKLSAVLNVERDELSLEPLVKESHIIGELGKPVGIDQHTDHDQKDSGDNLKYADVFFEAVEHRQKAMHGERRQQERHAQSQGIDQQQQNPLIHAFLGCRYCQYGGKYWSDRSEEHTSELQS